jgi:hypothetical protein
MKINESCVVCPTCGYNLASEKASERLPSSLKSLNKSWTGSNKQRIALALVAIVAVIVLLGRCNSKLATYRNAPQSARNALNAVKKVEARIEVGVNYNEYSTAVGEAWGDVKIFAESPDGKSLPEFNLLLTKAIADYKSVLPIWRSMVEYDTLYGRRDDVKSLQQRCWARAGEWTELAESLLDVEKAQDGLKRFVALPKKVEDFDATWKKLHDDILTEPYRKRK